MDPVSRAANSNDKLIDALERSLGKDRVFSFDEEIQKYPVLPTGITDLDKALGGGIAEGSLVEIAGFPQMGKTTIVMSLCGHAQKEKGYSVMWLDYEHAFNPMLAESMGMMLGRGCLVPLQPASFEDGEKAINLALEKGDCKVIVVDSLSTMQPEKFIEEGAASANHPLLAKLMANALKNWLHVLSEREITLIFINHLVEKMDQGSWGKQYTTRGGDALKFYSNIRLELHKIAWLTEPAKDPFGKDYEQKIGQRVKIIPVKNRHFPPYRQAFVDIIFGKSIQSVSDIENIKQEGIKKGVIEEAAPGKFIVFGERINGNAVFMKWLQDSANQTRIKEAPETPEVSSSPAKGKPKPKFAESQ